MLKILVWMNMPSHHQQAFFRELSKHEYIDLEVRYYGIVPSSRIELGWSISSNLPFNQSYIVGVDQIENSIPDWKDRIHIIPGIGSKFLKEVVELVISENVKWVHWSEPGGSGLNKVVKFNSQAFELLYPIFLNLKHYKNYAYNINMHALGALAIGKLAEIDFIKWGVKPQKIKYLPYSLDGVDPDQRTKVVGCSNEKSFCYLGTLEYRKGIDVLLKAFQLLVMKGCKWKLVLIGRDKTGGKYATLAKKLGIFQNVEFKGAIPAKEVSEHVSNTDVFVFPSRFDGWGVVLNEAAYLRKPLISNEKAGSAHHLIENGSNGFMVKSDNVESLKSAMQFYIDNPDKIELHGSRSFALVEKIKPVECAELFYSNIKELLE
ncbi:glycosyltransferase family 4 protein [Vibrio splendidus]